MNPFILLAKPMIAVGTYIAKLVVAGGMVLANGAQGDQPPQGKVDTEAAIVRVVVSPDNGTLSEMDVQLPNGEFYQLAGVAAERETSVSPASYRMTARGGNRPAPRATASAKTVAQLESETGRSMRCNVSLPSSADNGSGECTTDTGKKYEFSFNL